MKSNQNSHLGFVNFTKHINYRLFLSDLDQTKVKGN